jgi:hypothetical protein
VFPRQNFNLKSHRAATFGRTRKRIFVFPRKFFVGRGTDVNKNGPEDNWTNEDVAIDMAILVSQV